MKRKVILLFLIMFFSVWIVWAQWLAWNWVLWISKPDEPYSSRFEEVWQIDWVNSIKDTFTDLKWEKNPSTRWIVWSNLFNHCTSKGNWWRVPEIWELNSLLTYNEKNNKSAYTIHPNIISGAYWTATKDITLENNGRFVNFRTWYSSNFLIKNEDYNVICVHD